jgi:hypothetical protein
MNCLGCKKPLDLANVFENSNVIHPPEQKYYYCKAIGCQVFYCAMHNNCHWNTGVGNMAKLKQKKKRLDAHFDDVDFQGGGIEENAGEDDEHMNMDDAADSPMPDFATAKANPDDNNDEDDSDDAIYVEDLLPLFEDQGPWTQEKAWKTLLGSSVEINDIKASSLMVDNCEISSLVRTLFAKHNGRVFSKDARTGIISIVLYLLANLDKQFSENDKAFAIINLKRIVMERKLDNERLEKVTMNKADWERHTHPDDRSSTTFKPNSFFLYDSVSNHLKDNIAVRLADFEFNSSAIVKDRKAVLMNTKLVRECIKKKKDQYNAKNENISTEKKDMTRYIGVKLFADGFSAFQGQRHSAKSYQFIFVNLPRDIHNIFALTIKPWNIPSMFVLEKFCKDIEMVTTFENVDYCIVFCGFLCDHPEANDLTDHVGMTGIRCCKYCNQTNDMFLQTTAARTLSEFDEFVTAFNACRNKSERSKLKTATGYIRTSNPLRKEFVDVRMVSLEGLHCILFGLYPQLITLMTSALDADKYVTALQKANGSNPRRALIDIEKVLESAGWLKGGETDVLRQQSILILTIYHGGSGPVVAKNDEDEFTFFVVMMRIFHLILDTEPCTQEELDDQVKELKELCIWAAHLANEKFTFHKKKLKRDNAGNSLSETVSVDNDFRLPNFHQLLHSSELLEWIGPFRWVRTDLHERYLRNFTHQMHIHGAASNSDQCGHIMVNHLLRVQISLLSKKWLGDPSNMARQAFSWSFVGDNILKFSPQYQFSRLPRPHDHIHYHQLTISCFVEIKPDTSIIFNTYIQPWICQIVSLPDKGTCTSAAMPEIHVKHLMFEGMYPNASQLKSRCGLMLYRKMRKGDFQTGEDDSNEVIPLDRVVKTVQVVSFQGKYLFNQHLL